MKVLPKMAAKLFGRECGFDYTNFSADKTCLQMDMTACPYLKYAELFQVEELMHGRRGAGEEHERNRLQQNAGRGKGPSQRQETGADGFCRVRRFINAYVRKKLSEHLIQRVF